MLVQHQDQNGVCPLQEPDLHGVRLLKQPQNGVVPLPVVGTKSLVCRERGS